MSARVISWGPQMTPIGSAVVAIGVFDGVHMGHQALLSDTVADAARRGVDAVAVTFDRDPDQVVSPDTAAPQLLTLPDKLEFIAQAGVDAILVIPFTHELAEMCPEEFLDAVLLRGVKPLAVHVGGDFRFGCRAVGDVAAMQAAGVGHGFEVDPHELVSAGGAPVTSSRIRALVAAGDVTTAGELLGRAPRVVGTVHRGRGEGASLGFATANVVPVEFAALPADGVYAGRVVLSNGDQWAAAISVGTPPTFPEARDYLEAHLIGFDGDLYDQTLTLVFMERLRSLQPFASLELLRAAIAEDVSASLRIGGFPTPDPDTEWTAVMGPIDFHGSLAAGAYAFTITSPLEAAGIPLMWDPYPPEQQPSSLPMGGAYAHPFTLFVPDDRVAEAAALLAEAGRRNAAEAGERETVGADGAADTGSDADAAHGDDLDYGDDYIDDPAALEAAEQAVRNVDRQPRALKPEPLDGWKTVAGDIGYDKHRLGAIEYALSAAGIPAEWRPFSPTEAPLLKLFGLHETRFSLRVPEADAQAATLLIAEADDRGTGAESSAE